MANPTAGVKMFTTPYTDTRRQWPLAAGATTFYVGEMLGKNSAGNVTHLDDTARMYFVGIQLDSVPIVVDSADAAGDNLVNADRPLLFEAKIASAAAGDEGKKVFASYSDTVQYANGTYANYVGTVFFVIDSTHVVICPPWSPFHAYTGSMPGYYTAAAAAGTTLSAMDVGKIIITPLTSAQNVTLPPVASCSTGDSFTFVNTTANSSLLTLVGNASENINGANTFTGTSQQYGMLEVITDGTQWFASIVPAGTTTFSSTATFSEGINVVFGTVTGTKLGTGTTQKIGFWNATPIVQPANTVDYVTMLTNLGLRATGGTAAATFPGVVNAVGVVNTGVSTVNVGASTAAAGNSAGTATALPAGTGEVYQVTASDGTKGVIINAADNVNGRKFYLANGVSNQAIKVYPTTGGTINGAAANAVYTGASGAGITIYCTGSNTFYAT